MLDAKSLREYGERRYGAQWQSIMADMAANMTGRKSQRERRAIYVTINRIANARSGITPLTEIGLLTLLAE